MLIIMCGTSFITHYHTTYTLAMHDSGASNAVYLFFSFDSCGNFSCQSRKCCEVAPALPGNLGQYEWVKCLCTLEAASNWCCVWCWPLNPWGTGVLDVDTTSTPPCLFDAVVTTWPLSPRHQQAWLRLPTWKVLKWFLRAHRWSILTSIFVYLCWLYIYGSSMTRPKLSHWLPWRMAPINIPPLL